MNPVVHFEMPYANQNRVSKFYNSVFGWKMNDAGADMGHYVVASINGGFYRKSRSTNPYPSFVISVDNIEKAMTAIKKAGGKIISKPQDIPGVGLWSVFKDTEGNRVSILQPKM